MRFRIFIRISDLFVREGRQDEFAALIKSRGFTLDELVENEPLPWKIISPMMRLLMPSLKTAILMLLLFLMQAVKFPSRLLTMVKRLKLLNSVGSNQIVWRLMALNLCFRFEPMAVG
jgi:hypothetical protein